MPKLGETIGRLVDDLADGISGALRDASKQTRSRNIRVVAPVNRAFRVNVASPGSRTRATVTQRVRIRQRDGSGASDGGTPDG